jgi:hypothetical protein
MKHNLNYAWLVLVIVIIAFEIIMVLYFVPTITMPTPQEEQYGLPGRYTFITGSDSPVSIIFEVHDLISPDQAIPYVNDPIVYSFNITNLTNGTLEINHTINVVSPILESYVNVNVTVDAGKTVSLNMEKVVLKNEGINEVDAIFNIKNNSSFKMEQYIWAITQQTEDTVLFGKYGEILTLIVLIPSTIIAIKNLKDIISEKPNKSKEKPDSWKVYQNN